MLNGGSNEVTIFFLGAAVLCFAYGYMYRRTKVDRFREDIFSLRDELFDYMWRHNLSYSHPAYQNMRTALNGAVRFSDHWSLPVFLVMAYYVRRTPSQPHVLSETIQTLERGHREYFEALRERVWRR